MALTATIYHFQITLSDVDRGVYEALDLRVARHPSETMRYLVTRTLAYCLSYEDGIGFSKGGLSSAEEAPLSVRDATGVLRAWIDVEPEFLDALDRKLDKNSKFEVVRTDGQLYLTIGGETLNGTLTQCSLVPSA